MPNPDVELNAASGGFWESPGGPTVRCEINEISSNIDPRCGVVAKVPSAPRVKRRSTISVVHETQCYMVASPKFTPRLVTKLRFTLTLTPIPFSLLTYSRAIQYLIIATCHSQFTPLYRPSPRCIMAATLLTAMTQGDTRIRFDHRSQRLNQQVSRITNGTAVAEFDPPFQVF